MPSDSSSSTNAMRNSALLQSLARSATTVSTNSRCTLKRKPWSSPLHSRTSRLGKSMAIAKPPAVGSPAWNTHTSPIESHSVGAMRISGSHQSFSVCSTAVFSRISLTRANRLGSPGASKYTN